MMQENNEVPAEVVDLIRKKLSIVTFVSEEMIAILLKKSPFNSVEEWIVRATFEEYVYMHPEKYEHPADWWQAFKERFFSNWMLKKWPVRMKIVSVWSIPLGFSPEPAGKWRRFFKANTQESEV